MSCMNIVNFHLINSNTYIINGSGHMIMIEKAFEMREKILEFLNK